MTPRNFPAPPAPTFKSDIQHQLKQGKAKQKAWQKEVDAKVSQADAEKRYIALVEKLKGAYGYDPSKAAEPVGGS